MVAVKRTVPADFASTLLCTAVRDAAPVPGFALSGYKPGLCWKVAQGQGDRQFGHYVPCSEWRKKN
jgi:hypothetical protein